MTLTINYWNINSLKNVHELFIVRSFVEWMEFFYEIVETNQ